MSIDFGVACEQLRSHQFSGLFTRSLAWSVPRASLQRTAYSNQPCLPIAERNLVVVWQVSLTPDTPLTPTLRHQIYTDLLKKSAVAVGADDTEELSRALPLVIFTTADKRRSLWCQSLTESALYVAGQPTALWMYRLRRFAKNSQGLFSTVVHEVAHETAHEAAHEVTREESLYDKRLYVLADELYQGIEGIESAADRRLYGVLTLQRLFFLQQLQQKGWLNGDTWYLQTRFGAALQQGDNLFFAQCLRSLYRSLSLPSLERPLALQSAIGTVPFLGQLFDTHPLEEKYPLLKIRDQAFENLLGWLSEQMSSDRLNPWMAGEFSCWLERYWRRQAGIEPVDVGRPALAREMCDRTLDSWLLDRLGIAATSTSTPASTSEPTLSLPKQTLNDVLFNANALVCRRLVQEILPELKILDPYCSSGTLLAAFYRRLTDIFSILTGYIQQNKDAQLQIWRSALLVHKNPDQRDSEHGNLEHINLEQTRETKVARIDSDDATLQNIQERILKKNLFGVAHSAESAESAHFLLLSHLVATAPSVVDIEPLIGLEFSVMSGNALIGFISVDEERFEQVNRSDGSSVLQGNLLQPLAADSYQTIVGEKNIALEHYRSRSQLLAKSHTVPPYARASLLREEILTLDSKAQHELDTLLLNHMSQQLGIRYRKTQLANKPQRRLLTLFDVEVLNPFHWGYRFNTLVKRGGFDIVACCPPWGGVKPTVAEFIYQHQDLAERKGVSEKTLKTSKRSLSQADPVVAEAWLAYQDQYAYAMDYFYRSELYTHQNPIADGKPVRNQLLREKLFVEQCFNLLNHEGVAAVLVSEKMLQDTKSERLLQLLREDNDCMRVSLGTENGTDSKAALVLIGSKSS